MIVTGSEAFAAGAFGFTPDSDYAPGPGASPATAARSMAARRGPPIRPSRRTADGDHGVVDRLPTPSPGHQRP